MSTDTCTAGALRRDDLRRCRDCMPYRVVEGDSDGHARVAGGLRVPVGLPILRRKALDGSEPAGLHGCAGESGAENER